jgi:hypothetical protein
LQDGSRILNWAFGRFDLVQYQPTLEGEIRLTVMGERGEVKKWARKLADSLSATVD